MLVNQLNTSSHIFVGFLSLRKGYISTGYLFDVVSMFTDQLQSRGSYTLFEFPED